MNKKFKVGDKVKISENSPYAGQCSGIGAIKSKECDYYNVKFPSGYSNSYSDRDLILGDITDWRGEFDE